MGDSTVQDVQTMNLAEIRNASEALMKRFLDIADGAPRFALASVIAFLLERDDGLRAEVQEIAIFGFAGAFKRKPGLDNCDCAECLAERAARPQA